jgi:hypothetical protein
MYDIPNTTKVHEKLIQTGWRRTPRTKTMKRSRAMRKAPALSIAKKTVARTVLSKGSS